MFSQLVELQAFQVSGECKWSPNTGNQGGCYVKELGGGGSGEVAIALRLFGVFGVVLWFASGLVPRQW